MPAPETVRSRWTARPVLTLLVRAAVLAIPLVAGLAAGALASRLLPEAQGTARIAWWIGVLGMATTATLAADALARRLLPLTVLLRLTLAFPDHAPSRLRVALRASNIRRLQDRVQSPAHAALTDAERVVDIMALAAALNAHDRRTRGHSERVQALTRLVAEEMHLDVSERDRLGWAAFLHDIGKLEVPPAILNKPGPPDDDEWAVLRRHPADGARITAALGPWLGDAAGAIDEHHERFDGTGYPRGLAGDDISRAGRIVAVTDAFETITAARAYKGPTSPAEGRAELTRCAGTHFDPHVVRAFLDVSLGRLRWVLGIGSWIALVPVLGATRSRAAMRPAFTGTGTGLVGVAMASLLLASAPVATGPSPNPAPPAVAAPAPTAFDAPDEPDATLAATALGTDEGANTPDPEPPGTGAPDVDGALVHVRANAVGVGVTADVLGGVSVGQGGSGIGVEITTPLLP